MAGYRRFRSARLTRIRCARPQFALRGMAAGLLLFTLTAGAGGVDYRGSVLGDGEVEHRLSTSFLRWDASERENALSVVPSARFGLAAGYDIGIAAPLRREDDDQALRNLRLDAGIPLHRGGEGTQITLGLHLDILPTDAPLASGSDGAGIAVHLHDRIGAAGTRLDGVLGFERTDVALRQTPGYESANRLYYANRIEQPVTERLAVSGEAHTVIGVSGEEVQNQFAFALRPGLRYQASDSLSVRLTAGRDLADRGVEPQSTVRLTLTHQPVPPPSRSELMARIEGLEGESRALRDEAERLREDQALDAGRHDQTRERLELLQRRAQQLDVEVINRTGERSAGDAALEHLAGLGHYVQRRVERPAGVTREITHIEYRHDGFAEAAQELADVLPGVQLVSTNPELRAGVDARVTVGTDLIVREGQ